MAYSLAPHLHFALARDHAILLDVRADRYRAMGARAAGVLHQIATGAAIEDEEVLRDLIAADILHCGDDVARRATMVRPARQVRDVPDGPGTSLSALRVLAGLTRIIGRQRWRGFEACLTIAAKSKVAQPLRRDPDASVRIAKAYARARRWVPIRPICLRDSLCLLALLNRAGLDASLVLGVRVDPFAAHCWVQVDDMLLSDELDVVAEFTPILVL